MALAIAWCPVSHRESELKDMWGTSSSIAVQVLTHTMSEVSHRLMTASVALDARYLQIESIARVELAVLI